MLPPLKPFLKITACTSVGTGQRYVFSFKQNKLVCLYLGGWGTISLKRLNPGGFSWGMGIVGRRVTFPLWRGGRGCVKASNKDYPDRKSQIKSAQSIWFVL